MNETVSMQLHLPIISTYLGAFLLGLQTVLAFRVGSHRNRTRKGVGHENDTVLERRVRRHANMTEYAPIFLIALALFELIAGQTNVIMSFAVLFAVSRLSHAIGFSSSAGSHLVGLEDKKYFFPLTRAIGAVSTMILSLALAFFLVFHLLAMPGGVLLFSGG